MFIEARIQAALAILYACECRQCNHRSARCSSCSGTPAMRSSTVKMIAAEAESLQAGALALGKPSTYVS